MAGRIVNADVGDVREYRMFAVASLVSRTSIPDFEKPPQYIISWESVSEDRGSAEVFRDDWYDGDGVIVELAVTMRVLHLPGVNAPEQPLLF